MKEKFTLEYDMKGTPATLLWKYVSTPQGLAQWFADDVTETGNTLTFHWKGGSNDANLVASRVPIYIRMKWVDDDYEKSFFEMRITSSELTQGTTLVIADWSEDADDRESITDLWNHQVDILRRIIGCK